MTIRYSDSLRCTIRAGVSVFGLQQIAQDLLVEAARIDSRDRHRAACIQTLQEMQAQVEFHGHVWQSLWRAIRRLEDRHFSDTYRRKLLERRWLYALPSAFASVASLILNDECTVLEDHQSPRAQFLGTLVLAGDISPGEYSLGMLGRDFFSLEGTLEELTLHFGKDEHSCSHTLPVVYEPYYPEEVKS